MELHGYLAGLITLPAFWGSYCFVTWAFSKDRAYGGCLVCSHGHEHEVGERFNITEEASNLWHKYAYAKRRWHKKAVKAYWQAIKDDGGQYRTDVGI